MEMTLDEAIECFERDGCVGCKYHDSDEPCLEMAHEVAIKTLRKMREVENDNAT